MAEANEYRRVMLLGQQWLFKKLESESEGSSPPESSPLLGDMYIRSIVPPAR